ncbi:GNAT family N-acetyltransferase [Curtobacterium ammoniigenes]|uniref:GNAT family N-acetyltransferase n=1 Tax=Curtobacterium ammoniigenes TaxID=395387 RepID=UPI00082F04F5|nr:GNAT family N-acetyltransferase [Curtobacterium ammoniigenes]
MSDADFDARYELRWGAPALDTTGKPDAATMAHIEAIALGFLQDAPDRDALAADVRDHMEEHEVTLDVFRREPAPDSMDAAAPVGTFGALPKPMSWGDGTSVDTFAIRAVTVRPTERRRGILRRMMTDALQYAAAQEFPLASLTASEGTIYRRFGFGPAIRERKVTVQRSRALPLLVAPRGEVVVVPPASLRDGLARAVFDRFHSRTLGSMVRNVGAWGSLLGHRLSDPTPDRSIRAAVHRLDSHVDGYVTYRVHEQDGSPTTVEIVDLIAVDEQAYLGLWEFLLSIDLTDRVIYPFARIEDPLPLVLADTRAFDIDHEEDHVWLRILDPAATLESRPFAADGSVTLHVHDTLGYADGTYRLTVLGGRGRVDRIEGAGELELDVSTLGSLLLGAVDPVVLHDVGLVTGSAAAAETLRSLLRPARTPHGMTYF